MVAVAGLEEAKRLDLQKYLLQKDSITVYILLSGLSTNSSLEPLISHCKNLLLEGEGTVRWCHRDTIPAPDALAKKARTLAVSNFWSSEFPFWLKEMNCNDMYSLIL